MEYSGTGLRLPYNFIYAQPHIRNHYHIGLSGWVENVVLVSRDGFEKRVVVKADIPDYRLPGIQKIDFSKPFDPGAVVTERVLYFKRAKDRRFDGMAVFEEVW